MLTAKILELRTRLDGLRDRLCNVQFGTPEAAIELDALVDDANALIKEYNALLEDSHEDSQTP